MEKLIRDGKVAVMVSRGFGAGWSTWNMEHKQTFLFDRRIAELVDAEKLDEAEAMARKLCPDAYLGGVDGLTIEWLDEGTAFCVEDYDGAESLRTVEDLDGVA